MRKAVLLIKRFAAYINNSLKEASKADPLWEYRGTAGSYLCFM